MSLRVLPNVSLRVLPNVAIAVRIGSANITECFDVMTTS
jgi:hypothetical protein